MTSALPNPVHHQLVMHPIQVNPLAAHRPSVDSAHSAISNPSTISSSIFPTSTAATSPVSNFHQMGFAPGHMSAYPPPANPNSTTRVLLLSDFNKELKTRDIQHVFVDWEDDRGGFKIKWVDDTSCLIVFADAGVAKRAFVNVLSNPPPALITIQQDGGAKTAKLTPYNKPDVPQILASVQNRPRSRSNASQSLHSRASSATSIGGLGRRPSMGTLAGRNRTSLSGPSALTGRTTMMSSNQNSLGHHQGLDSIDNFQAPHSNSISSHMMASGVGSNSVNSLPNTINSEYTDGNTSGGSAMRPRIEDAGKRFIAAGLSKPASTITQQPISEIDEDPDVVTYNLTNLTIEEESLTPTAATH